MDREAGAEQMMAICRAVTAPRSLGATRTSLIKSPACSSDQRKVNERCRKAARHRDCSAGPERQ
jgi:hypothetical protein